MPIPVAHEDAATLKAWGLRLEKEIECCVLCCAQTRTWHLSTNQPVCGACAEAREPADLPARRADVASA